MKLSLKNSSISALVLMKFYHAYECHFENPAEKAALIQRLKDVNLTGPTDQGYDSQQQQAMGNTYKVLLIEKLQQETFLDYPCTYKPIFDSLLGNTADSTLMRGINDDTPKIEAFNCHDKECDVAMDLSGIWGYGCWCHFGAHLMNGRGVPVNPHDAACKRMQLCLRCAEMDGYNDGYECNPREVSYNSTLGQAGPGQSDNINSWNSACSALNPNDLCSAHVCTCEIQLVNDILQLVWQTYTHDPMPRHPSNPYGGTFDYNKNCLTDPGTKEIDCCGKYPFRYTYNQALDR